MGQPTGCSGELRQGHCSFHVNGHNARNALLLHGDTNQLFGHFHGNFVVTDEQELSFFAHALHQLDIALGVGIVQRSVHLIE